MNTKPAGKIGLGRLLAPVLVILFTVLCGQWLVRQGPFALDERVLLWFRASEDTGRMAGPPWVSAVWLGMTWLGDTTPRIVLAAILVFALMLRRRWQYGLFVFVVLTGGLWLSSAIKHLVSRARPDIVTRLDHAHSMSFPSGHALNSLLFYLIVALIAGHFMRPNARLVLWGLALILTLATGLSRLALGVHYPSDVLAGWVIGAAWLWLCHALARRYWPVAVP